MAVDALGTELLFLRHGGVAGVAIELGMRPLEGEFETHQVVEVRHFPDVIAMTVATGGPEPAGMFIVGLVASRTIPGNRILEVATAVAVTAA